MKDGWRQNCQCDNAPQSWVKRNFPKAAPLMLLLTGVLRGASQLLMKVLYM